MINFISQAEIEELCEAMLSQYRGRDAPTPQRVDIDGFVQDYLKCTIRYEAFAEDDPNKIGFAGDGRSALKIKPFLWYSRSKRLCLTGICSVRRNTRIGGLHSVTKPGI